MKKLTHKDFLIKLEKQNKYYKKGQIFIESKYIKSTEKIIVRDKYGLYLIRPKDLLKGCGANIVSSMNKNENIKNKIEEVHGEIYDCSKIEYVNNYEKITLSCSKHGDFKKSSNKLIGGQGCPKCGREKSRETKVFDKKEFEKRANKIHDNFYDYTDSIYLGYGTKLKIKCPNHGDFWQEPKSHIDQKSKCPKCFSEDRVLINKLKFVEKCSSFSINDKIDYTNIDYVNSLTKVILNCNEHGSFSQTPKLHSEGQSCPKCADKIRGWTYNKWRKQGEKSKNFDSFKCYIVKCYNDNEEFYKIGKTFLTLEKRLRPSSKMVYSYEILKIFEGGSREISELEHKLQKENKEFRYKPEIPFGGMYECYSDIKNLLKYIEDNNI